MSATARLVREVLVARLGEWYGVRPEDVTDDRPFAEHGLTSRDAVALTALLGNSPAGRGARPADVARTLAGRT
ncbi:acyl carrier protein, partial [Actinospica acidiphila]|nr:acyl carrier protein [Actinospica acidiphila]